MSSRFSLLNGFCAEESGTQKGQKKSSRSKERKAAKKEDEARACVTCAKTAPCGAQKARVEKVTGPNVGVCASVAVQSRMRKERKS